MQKLLIHIQPLFALIFVVITLIYLFVYLVLQQNYRSNANDPQIQIAEEISMQLEKGAPLQYFVPPAKIDISKSLGTFIIFYKEKGDIITGSALLNGNLPQIPKEVFDITRKKGETRFTWQPQKNVRIAVVVSHINSREKGFLAVGRSIREVESRIYNMGATIFIGWALTSLVTFAFIIFLKRYPHLKAN